MRSISLMPPMPLVFPLKAQPAVNDASDPPAISSRHQGRVDLWRGLPFQCLGAVRRVLRWAIDRRLRSTVAGLVFGPWALGDQKVDVMGMMGKFDIKSQNFDLRDLLWVHTEKLVPTLPITYSTWRTTSTAGPRYLGITYLSRTYTTYMRTVPSHRYTLFFICFLSKRSQLCFSSPSFSPLQFSAISTVQ